VNLIVKPAARWDVIKASAFYEMRQAGLGAEFEDEVETVWRTIAAQPRLFGRASPPRRVREVRLALVHRFPYEVRGADVVVLSVTHARTRRRTWPGRLGPRNP
jgi:hypothetical protein